MNNGQVYVEFGKHISMYKLGMLHEGVISFKGSNNKEFIKNLEEAYKFSHLYHIDEITKKLLLLTKPPKNTDIQHIPFKSMFIDVDFTKEEIKQFTNIDIEYNRILGVIIQEGMTRIIDNEGNYRDVPSGTAIRVIILGFDDKGFVFNTFHLQVNLIEEYKDMPIQTLEMKELKNTKKFIKNFSVNILNLILEPEIKIIFRDEDKERNLKRMKKGLIPFPFSSIIKIDGERKIYIDKMIANGDFKYSHRFWVQGHYRLLKSSRYTEHKGKKLWICPYIKGKKGGVLIEKTYKVDKK